MQAFVDVDTPAPGQRQQLWCLGGGGGGGCRSVAPARGGGGGGGGGYTIIKAIKSCCRMQLSGFISISVILDLSNH